MPGLLDLRPDEIELLAGALDFVSFCNLAYTCKRMNQLCASPVALHKQAQRLLYSRLHFDCMEPIALDECRRLVREQLEANDTVRYHLRKLSETTDMHEHHLYHIMQHRLLAAPVLTAAVERPESLAELGWATWGIEVMYRLEAAAYHLASGPRSQYRSRRLQELHAVATSVMLNTGTPLWWFLDAALSDVDQLLVFQDRPAQDVIIETAELVRSKFAAELSQFPYPLVGPLACLLLQLWIERMGIWCRIRSHPPVFYVETDFGCIHFPQLDLPLKLDDLPPALDSPERTHHVLCDLLSLHEVLPELDSFGCMMRGVQYHAHAPRFFLNMVFAYVKNDFSGFNAPDDLDDPPPHIDLLAAPVRPGQFVLSEGRLAVVIDITESTARVLTHRGAQSRVPIETLSLTDPGPSTVYKGILLPAAFEDEAPLLGQHFTSYHPDWSVFV